MNALSFTSHLSEAPFTSNSRRWVHRRLMTSVDLVVDGRPLGEILGAAAEGCVSVVDGLLASDARAVLLEGRVEDDWWEDAGRVPILTCPCGDVLCGTLSCRITFDTDAVQWTEWRWQNVIDPDETLDAPAFTFDARAYRETVEAALNVAEHGPSTEMRVRRPRRLLLGAPRRYRLTESGIYDTLDWVFAEALSPTSADDCGDYADFLDDMEAAQATLAGVHPVTDEAWLAAIARLRGVLASEHAVSLPEQTRQAFKRLVDTSDAQIAESTSP